MEVTIYENDEPTFLSHISDVTNFALEVVGGLRIEEHTKDNFEFWVKSWSAGAMQNPNGFEDVQDVWDDLVEELEQQEINPGGWFDHEKLISASDIFEFYRENESDCDEALGAIGYELGYFGTIGEAMNAAVHAELCQRASADLYELQQALWEADTSNL